jgi:hypothetical protein
MKLCIKTLGCKVNAYESECIEEDFKNHDYEIVSDFNDADVIVVNTCTVTNQADAKSRKLIRQARKNEKACLVVCGCSSQQHKDSLMELGVDILLGTSGKSRIYSLVENYLKTKEKISLFNDIHGTITGIKIGDYKLVSNLIGNNISVMGSWTNYELCLVLFVFGFIIGKLYKLTFKEIVEGAIEGIKEIIPVALMTIAANILFLLVNSNSEGYTFFSTIINFLQGSKIAVVPFGLISLIGSLLYNDFPYLLSSLYGAVVSFSDQYVLIGMIAQTIHGLVQLIAPTSVILVAGLTYFKIPYTKWLKENWKLFLSLFILIIILLILV